jgi:toxin ParE1/3/4
MDIKYDITITESAQKDLENIYFYISEELLEDETASNIISELKEKIFSLDSMPGRYALVSDFSLAKRGYRHINVKNYIILYLVDEKKKNVTIARIIHGRMNYSKYLI